MSEKNFRIRTNLNDDKVVHVNLTQDVDFLEILSLKIRQADTYKMHVSNYGVIVGRVQANENFGIPNAKVSVFIEVDENDIDVSELANLYSYETTRDKNKEGIRYNLLPDTSNDICYKVVGTFPNKRLVLDNDTQIEIFDKYWKYTTVTNKSGDYMIFGVPTGNQTVHVDIDLSDIGILSQKPIDFMYKGYNITQFDNARQFKDSTNLDNLSQILSQNSSVHVYPFWGDTNVEEIAISRCDIQVQYKFESTCVFFGSIITDNFNNNINHKCTPSKHAGFNRFLVTGEGTIEMIRKTPDNLVEEYQIQGNRLIDGDGVWCYQIPMNLDYVGTDEFGNIVPTDDPKKGIATRTSVRFRVSMQETNNEGVSRHRAKYLIPNVQNIVKNDRSYTNVDYARSDIFPHIENPTHFEDCYEFGSATPNEYFRDLYWNKVYSIKNYIPRIQTNGKESTQNYSAIRTVNNNGNLNPVPFNHARFRLVFAYRVLCMIMTIVIFIISVLNTFLSSIVCLKILWVRPFKFLCRWIKCISISGGLTEDIEDNVEFFPGCKRSCDCMMKCSKKNCEKRTDKDELINVVQQTLSQEYDTVNLDFYNDWLNGSLYLPLWFWKKTKKKKFLFGLFSKKAVNTFCSCKNHYKKLRVTQNCSLPYDKESYDFNGDDKGEKYHNHFPNDTVNTYYGVVKEFENRQGLKIYYYAPGLPNIPDYKNVTKETRVPYVRLYSTDIILLGSLNSCDLDNYPNVFPYLPSTTANVPFISTIKSHNDDEKDNGYVEITGMDWLHEGEKGKPKYGAGLLMDLACNAVYTKPKSCINIERMSELGVSLDTHEEVATPSNNLINYIPRDADGMITRYEIVDNETRAMFASLNNNGLTEKVLNPNTGYKTYKLRYVYPNDFDGHLKVNAYNYTKMMKYKTFDNKDENYIDYRFGLKHYDNKDKSTKFFYSIEKGNFVTFPLFNNSFYFYFGLNEGKTSIDKFNNKFYSQCYKNVKYPFTMEITSNAGKWCADSVNGLETDYGTIDIKFDAIKTPFSYTLYDEFNNEIITENEVTLDYLKFGYDIVDGGGAYVFENNKFKKNGQIKYFKTGKTLSSKLDNKVLLENKVYRLKITDVNGNSLTQTINLEQVPINLNHSTLDLGDKFYSGITNKEDFCGDIDKYGEIRIYSIILDGTTYGITNVKESTIEKGLQLTLDNNGGDVLLQITPQDTEDERYNKIEKCACDNGGKYYFFSDKQLQLQFRIWVPGNYDIKLTQICNGELNDNVMTFTATINNGKPFNAYINEMPLRFILGKNEDYMHYNPKFYWTDLGRQLKQSDAWFNLNYEIDKQGNLGAYVFADIIKKNESIWSDFIPVSLNENGTFFDEDSVNEMVLYKYNSLFTLCNGFYVVDNADNSMTISHSGGRGVILFKGCYPQYDEPNDATLSEIKDTNFNADGEYHTQSIREYIVDSIGSVTVDPRYPNIVTYNYTCPISELDYPKMLYSKGFGNSNLHYNKLIFMPSSSDYEQQGNYFAAFTMNGCLDNEGNSKNGCRHKQVPYLSKSDASSFNDVIINDDKNKKYFRGQFIDKRFDYSFLITTPYSGNEIKYIDEKDDNSWMLGRLSGLTFNGVEMAYNNQKEYQIIGENLEYNTVINYENSDGLNNKIIINDDVSKKRFYKTILRCGNQNYNIVNFMHGDKNEQIVDSTIKSVPLPNGIVTTKFNEYPMVRGCDLHGLPTCDKIKFTCSSCSYNCEVGLFEDDSTTDEDKPQLITGETEEIGETEFNISARNMINNQLRSLLECAANDDFNVSFSSKDLSGSNPVTFISNRFKIDFKLNRDTVDNSHKSYTLRPFLFNVRSGEGDNYINNIEKVKKSKRLEGDDSIIENIKAHRIEDFKYETKSKIFENSDSLGYGFISDKFNKNFNHFIYENEEGRQLLLFDDTTEFKNLLFKCDKPLKLNILNTTIRLKYELLSIGFIRNYINSEDDNLTKELSTVQFTSIYDIRKFDMYCVESKIVKNNDGSISGSTESGSTEFHGSDSIIIPGGKDESTKQDINIGGNIDIPSSDVSGTSTTNIQYAKYAIKIENDPKINQEFRNHKNIAASIRIDGKTTNNIIISSNEDGSEIYLETYWSGDLAGIYLKDKDVKVNIFLEMPSKLIYKLSFTHKKTI